MAAPILVLRRAALPPTFADALARLRQHLWFEQIIISTKGIATTKPLPSAVQGILETARYAP